MGRKRTTKSIQVSGSGICGYGTGWIAVKNIEDIFVFKKSRLCVDLDVVIKHPDDITLVFVPGYAITSEGLFAQFEEFTSRSYNLELVNMSDTHRTISKDLLLGMIFPIDISKRKILPLKEKTRP